jgi:membrane protein DedA with SNARE-associated domain
LIEGIFREYGVLAVAPISFLENLIGLNAYFPGSVVILGAMALTSGQPQLAACTFLAIFAPSFAAHQVNFLIGRHFRTNSAVYADAGRYKTSIEINLLFASTLWHPHFAALTSIDSGAQGMSYRRFLSFFTAWFLLWNLFWGVTMYAFGLLLPRESLGLPIIVGFLVVWTLWDLLEIGKRLRQALNRERGDVTVNK